MLIFAFICVFQGCRIIKDGASVYNELVKNKSVLSLNIIFFMNHMKILLIKKTFNTKLSKDK